MIYQLQLIDLVNMIEEPNREPCLAIWRDNLDLFSNAWGSSHNHQARPGGYLDHIRDVMLIGCALHDSLSNLRPLMFTKRDALPVLYLHDIEKPWRFNRVTGEKNPGLVTKAQREEFRLDKLAQYKIVLTPEQQNALKYVEGEGDDYTPGRRVMNELAAFCHLCDVTSARIWHTP